MSSTSSTTRPDERPPDPLPPPLVVDVPHTGTMLGISEREAWYLVKSGAVESRFYGRRRLVTVASIEAFLASLPTQRP